MVLRALFLTVVVLSLFGSLVSLYVNFSLRRYPGSRLWAGAVFCLLLGMLGIALRGTIPLILSIVPANVLIILVPCIIGHSLRLFYGTGGRPWPEYAGGLLFIVLFLLATTLGTLRDRVLVVGLSYGVLWIYPGLLTLRPGAQFPDAGNGLLGFSFLGLAALSWARVWFTLTSEADPVNFLEMRGFQEVYLIVGSGLWLSVLSGYILLTNQRLGFELRRETEDLKAEKLTRDRFLSLIAHDLRGPMGAQVQALEMLEELTPRNESSSEAATLLGIAVRQSRNMSTLLEDLLAWASVQQNRMEYRFEALRLSDILDPPLELLRPQAEAKQVRLLREATASAEAARVRADRNSCLALLRNLIGNGIKFSPAGESLRVIATAAAGGLRIEIVDRGGGIASETLVRIRDGERIVSSPGTAGEPGSGMGLILCREYVRGNRGEMTIESAPGAGMRVVVSLPAVESA